MKIRKLKSEKVIIEISKEEIINFFVKLGIGLGFYLLNEEIKKINERSKK